MASSNKGRQIYLTKSDILELSGLVECTLTAVDDDFASIQSDQVYAKGDLVEFLKQEALENRQRKAKLEKLDAKLWFYEDVKAVDDRG